MDIRRITDSFSVSPQIESSDCAILRERGFALVINNRPDGEELDQPAGADIETAALAAGMAYRAISVVGGFGGPQIEAMWDAIEAATGPVFAYCRTGTRSTLLWSLAQASKGGDPDTIADAAAGAGYDIAPVRAAVDHLANGG